MTLFALPGIQARQIYSWLSLLSWILGESNELGVSFADD
jgi:hypothetical protein